MHPKFAEAAESLSRSFERLVAMTPVKPTALPKDMPKSGIYLFSDGNTHLYVGRSRDLRKRCGRHCRPGATHRMAAFAFQLARHETGRTKATYKKGEGSRIGLMEDATFAAAFLRAKERIRAMDYRYVDEPDPLRQMLPEVYCAVALDTKFNDFDTH